MYLHKRGTEFYINTFSNLRNELILKTRDNNKFSVRDCLENKYTDPRHYVEELLNHSTNIQEHIASEENVLKKLLDQTHQITIGDMKKSVTSQEFQQLMDIVKNLDSLHTDFKQLHNTLTHGLLENLTNSSADQTKSAENIERQEYTVIEILKRINQKSSEMAVLIKFLLQAIQKEEELIKKEEEAINDFNKNMMSWF